MSYKSKLSKTNPTAFADRARHTVDSRKAINTIYLNLINKQRKYSLNQYFYCAL